jgi:hypothetical protein
MEEYVDPIRGVPPKSPVDGHSEQGFQPERARATVFGHVVVVHRRNVHRDEGHILDTTVGGEDHTELIVRVESGPYMELDGKRVAITLAPL